MRIFPPLFPWRKPISAEFLKCADNAIEGAVLFPEKERYIRLEARLAKGILAIKWKNPGKEPVMNEKGRPQTTKNDKKSHGYGLLSIQESVKKYGRRSGSPVGKWKIYFVFICEPVVDTGGTLEKKDRQKFIKRRWKNGNIQELNKGILPFVRLTRLQMRPIPLF